jgi:hypothetical protein
MVRDRSGCRICEEVHSEYGLRNMHQVAEMDDDLRPEYDFTQMPVVARGKGRKPPSEIDVR